MLKSIINHPSRGLTQSTTADSLISHNYHESIRCGQIARKWHHYAMHGAMTNMITRDKARLPRVIDLAVATSLTARDELTPVGTMVTALYHWVIVF